MKYYTIMKLSDKYNFQQKPDSISLHPTKSLQKLSQYFLIGIFIAALILPFFKDVIGEVLYYSIYVLLGYSCIHSLYDILIRAKICYTFDLKNNAVFRDSPIGSKKKIMTLEEAVIFVNSEMGSWHYRLGAKKSHFIKSYTISENFGSGKKSENRQKEYEDQILAKIYTIIESACKVKI